MTRAAIRSRLIRRRRIRRRRSRRRHLRHRGLAFSQTRVPIVPEHFGDLGEKPARIHVALHRPTHDGRDVDGTVRSLTLPRSDRRGRIAAGRRNMFCIRLHFVLEERIGVGKIGAERFLTIDEGARRNVFSGRRHDLRRQEFRDDREHDDDLAARFASKALGGDRNHRLGASRACHAGRTLMAHVRCQDISGECLRAIRETAEASFRWVVSSPPPLAA